MEVTLIQEVIVGYLNENLPVPAYTQKPQNAPNRYVLLEKTGSGKGNHLPSATIAFQSYAESDYEAGKLNEILKKVVENMIELSVMRYVNLNSDYNFTDTTKKEHRYQAVFDIGYYD